MVVGGEDMDDVGEDVGMGVLEVILLVRSGDEDEVGDETMNRFGV